MTETPHIPPPVAPGPPPQKSGCLKWGCLGCSALLILCVAFVAVVAFFVLGAIKSTDVYKGARDAAVRDPRVIQALGSPVEAGLLVWGSVNVNGGAGQADIDFPIHGPKGRARVHAEGTKESGSWHYTELTVTPEQPPNSTPINLLLQPQP